MIKAQALSKCMPATKSQGTLKTYAEKYAFTNEPSLSYNLIYECKIRNQIAELLHATALDLLQAIKNSHTKTVLLN